MLQKCVGNSQVAFTIFKIYGIDFMRHGAASYFAFFCFLLKIIHAYIRPYVAAKINQNIVDPFDAVKMSGEMIIVLYLSSKLHSFKAKFSVNKFISKCYPVLIGISNPVGIKVTCCSTKL